MSSRLIKTRSNEVRCVGRNIIDTRGKHCPPLSKECIHAIHKLLPYSHVIHLSDPIGQVLLAIAKVSTTTPVYEFLQHGRCDTSEVDVEHDNLLHLASVGGSTEVTIELLDKNRYDINGAGLGGRTPALMAAFCGNKRILELLVDNKCNMGVVDDDTLNVLHVAVDRGHLDIVKYVLSFGVEKESRVIETGQTPLLLASVQRGHRYILEFLVEYGCDPNAVDSKNNNAMHWAAMGNALSTLEYLIHLGVEIDHVNSDGYTPLMTAVETGKNSIMKMLVDNGCDTKAAHIAGSNKNVLHVSASNNRYSILKYVLTLGIDIESKTSLGMTALMLAASRTTKDMTKLMVDSGANLTASDSKGCDVMFHAAYGGDMDIVKYLKSLGIAITGSSQCPKTPVQIAVEKDQLELVPVLNGTSIGVIRAS